ncbi:hypothetical protein DFJ77DRAFT_543219 [Powellomyces hirtus]|nr:hypothetical protein DFJ77DRAFT_543219 [Powellomyces hirtus]
MTEVVSTTLKVFTRRRSRSSDADPSPALGAERASIALETTNPATPLRRGSRRQKPDLDDLENTAAPEGRKLAVLAKAPQPRLASQNINAAKITPTLKIGKRRGGAAQASALAAPLRSACLPARETSDRSFNHRRAFEARNRSITAKFPFQRTGERRSLASSSFGIHKPADIPLVQVCPHEHFADVVYPRERAFALAHSGKQVSAAQETGEVVRADPSAEVARAETGLSVSARLGVRPGLETIPTHTANKAPSYQDELLYVDVGTGPSLPFRGSHSYESSLLDSAFPIVRPPPRRFRFFFAGQQRRFPHGRKGSNEGRRGDPAFVAGAGVGGGEELFQPVLNVERSSRGWPLELEMEGGPWWAASLHVF